MNTIFKSLTFWTLVAGLLAFVAKFFLPTFPLDAVQILAAVLFLLGLFGVTPAFRAQGAMTAGIASSLAFWWARMRARGMRARAAQRLAWASCLERARGPRGPLCCTRWPSSWARFQ